MKHRDGNKKRKATMMLTIPVSAIWRFFHLWRDERRRKKISAALLKRRRGMKRD
jgi:hypothetical protein